MISGFSSAALSRQFRSLLRKGATYAVLVLLSPLGMAAVGLRGWWQFDNDFNDASGRGLHGSPIGAPGFDGDVPAGRTGQSVVFHNFSEGVRVPANPGLNANTFTLGYYVNLRGSTNPGTSGLKRLTAREGYTFETAVGDAHAVTPFTSVLQFSYYGVGLGWQRTNVAPPTTGWVHVVWRNSPTTGMQLFLDGVQRFSGPAVTAAISGYMNFGVAQTNVEGFDGLMDDIFLWEGELTDVEIESIAANGFASYGGDPDHDGLPSWWENLYGLDPEDNGETDPDNGADGDKDKDGLKNSEEFVRGTNPTLPDTDTDGLKDGDEITRGTNPLLSDTDTDGLSDGQEVTIGTDPLDTDTDNDTHLDGVEVQFGSNPLNATSIPPPAAFLVFQLSLDGNAQDSSAQHNNGSVLGGAQFVDDSSPAGGQAINLTADSMGVNVPANAALGSNAFTLCYWVKPTSLQTSVGGVERLTSRAADAFETAIGNRIGLQSPAAPDLTLSYFQGGWQTTNQSLVLNQWSHVTWRNTPAGMTLFINGVVAFTGPAVPVGRPGVGHMNIGTRHNGLEGFEGLMDDVRLYRIALKDAEIAEISTPVGILPFEITSIVRENDGSLVTLNFRSRPGRIYAVDFCTNLAAPVGQPGSWAELTDFLASAGAETVYEDNIASHLPRAFYRVRDVTP